MDKKMTAAPYETMESAIVYEGAIVDVKRDRIALPNGGTALREIVLRGEAAAILPVDSDGRVVLVRQYRHAVGKIVTEIPAGMLDAGEDPRECAIRELREETGLTASRVDPLFKMNSAIGFCSEAIYIYEARGLTSGETDPDDEEFIEVVKLPLDEAVGMIFAGEITDGKTIAALLAYGRSPAYDGK